MAGFSGASIQVQCLKLIIRNPTPGGEQIGQVVHRPVQPIICGDPVMLRGNRSIGDTAPTMLMTTTQHVARHQMPLPGSDTKPAQCQGLILSDATAIEEDLPEQRLRFNNALAGREQNRLRRTGRAFFKHGVELGAVEYFFAPQLKTHTSTQRRNRL